MISTRYKTSQVYMQLRGDEGTVPWHKAIWFSWGIPKHSFLAWLFVLVRNPTRDRLRQWGLQVDEGCLLCTTLPESRDHLFYECPFTWSVWEPISQRTWILPQREWSRSVAEMQTLGENKDLRKLKLLAWQSVIYWVWQERNKRLHHNQSRPAHVLIALICRQIKERILSFRIDSPAISSRLLQRWFELGNSHRNWTSSITKDSLFLLL